MKNVKLFAVLMLLFSLNVFMLCADNGKQDYTDYMLKSDYGAKRFASRELSSVVSRAFTDKDTPARETVDRSVWSSIGRGVVFYIPNLLADLLDIVSFEFSAGNTAALDVHASYYCNFAMENTDAYFIGNAPRHRFGVGRREAQRMAALCWSYDDVYVSEICGDMPTYAMKDAAFNLTRYYAEPYKAMDVDMWAIGFRAAMFLGVAADVHLLEIPDFLCQIFAYDLSGDNWK